MDDTQKRRARFAFALIADMAGDGCSTMASIRKLALKHMRELGGSSPAGAIAGALEAASKTEHPEGEAPCP